MMPSGLDIEAGSAMEYEINRFREFFKADTYAARAGIEIDEASEGKVVCSMAITPEHLNAGGSVQGGAIFTLADFAFAVHSNQSLAMGEDVGITVAQSCAISFLKASRGSKLFASSECLSKGRSISVYRISITDDLGQLVAEMHGNGFTTHKKTARPKAADEPRV
jgi:acyl-CoA thioesterase